MKFHIEIDCTPIEARQFLGLPDVEPLQTAMMEDMKERMAAAAKFMDPEALAKAWFPVGVQGMEQFQKLMTGIMEGARAAGAAAGRKPDKPEKK